MALWGKTDTVANRPKFIQVDGNGVIAQDASGKKLVFLDEAEALENVSKGANGAGWYLVLTTNQGTPQERIRMELLIAIADAPAGVADDSDIIETGAGLDQP